MFLIYVQSLSQISGLGYHVHDDILRILVRNRVIDDEMRGKLKGMKGFRNIIVHRYAGIDDRLSYEFLGERLVDFEEFIGKINEFMNRKSKL